MLETVKAAIAISNTLLLKKAYVNKYWAFNTSYFNCCATPTLLYSICLFSSFSLKPIAAQDAVALGLTRRCLLWIRAIQRRETKPFPWMVCRNYANNRGARRRQMLTSTSTFFSFSALFMHARSSQSDSSIRILIPLPFHSLKVPDSPFLPIFTATRLFWVLAHHDFQTMMPFLVPCPYICLRFASFFPALSSWSCSGGLNWSHCCCTIVTDITG